MPALFYTLRSNREGFAFILESCFCWIAKSWWTVCSFFFLHGKYVVPLYHDRPECVCAQSRGHVQLFVAPGTVTRQVSLPMKFSRQEYCSRGPFPTPGALPDPGIETARLASPVLAGNSLPLVPPGKPNFGHYCFTKEISLNSYSCNISFSSSCF